MLRRGWLFIAALFVAGAVVGAAAMLISIEGNRRTSTDAFCVSCHAMARLAADPHFRQSPHISSAAGVIPSCGDCHIPKSNWFVETYAHASSGIRDLLAETFNNFDDPATWEARRVALADEVREQMRRSDSATCRNCHDANAIQPVSERGRAAHALLREGRMTCIDCHFNLVHGAVPPSMNFIRGSGLGGEGR
jgi:nitrate/TMAO reductase-like tetraheme cytochrome c subunit